MRLRSRSSSFSSRSSSSRVTLFSGRRKTGKCNVAQRVNWRHLPLILTASYALAPMFLLVTNSFKTDADVTNNPMGLPESWTFGNYTNVWTTANLGTAYVNTLIITTATVVLQCV